MHAVCWQVQHQGWTDAVVAVTSLAPCCCARAVFKRGPDELRTSKAGKSSDRSVARGRHRTSRCHRRFISRHKRELQAENGSLCASASGHAAPACFRLPYQNIYVGMLRAGDQTCGLCSLMMIGF